MYTKLVRNILPDLKTFLFAHAVNPLDYSHTGPGFFTWHRLLNLNFEWLIQGMLQDMGRNDYYTFRLPYWDWRTEWQKSPMGVSSEELFSLNRLGETRNVSGYPRVFGSLFNDGWDTICWLQPGKICDPRISTGPLQRCPFTGTDPCSSDNPDWPNNEDLQNALSFNIFDVPNYNIMSMDGFRNYVDGNVSLDIEGCRTNRMCQCFPGGAQCSVTDGPVIAFDSQMHAKVC